MSAQLIEQEQQQQQKTKNLGAYSVYVVTWNVGSRFPDNISLRNLLGLSNVAPQQQQPEHALPDVYAIGLQEVNAHPQQQVLGLFKTDPWTQKAKDTLSAYDYVCVKREQMQGLLLTLLVRRKHVAHLQDIEADYTRTGFGGIWGNKGAVSVRLTLYGCGLTFVTAHLAAHDHQLDERIEDYKQILEHHHYHVARYRGIYDHDYVFWFGDLNFRLHGEDTAEEVRDAALQEHLLPSLLQRDQLLHVRERTQEAFQLLHERLPAFPPTFKFKEGTSEYDMKRRPAWTDRILYAVQPTNRQPNAELTIEQRSYKSHPGYTISDHKPVSSEFEIQLYAKYRAPCIVFHDIGRWNVGKELMVAYNKPLDFDELERDWIGIYRVDYADFADYVSYEYVHQSDAHSSSSDSPGDPYFESRQRRRRHHRHSHQRLQRLREGDHELVRIEFPDDVELDDGGRYLLIYFQNTGIRGVSSVAGISKEFVASKPARSERVDNID